MEIKPQNARLPLPGRGTFSLVYDSSFDLVSWQWQLLDLLGNPVEFRETATAADGAFSWVQTVSTDTREIICPSDPVHSRVTLTATAILKDKSGSTKTEKAQTEISFGAVWGGVMGAKYPHPVDWDKPWGADPTGQRALVLMFDLINQMPEELRSAAGSIPITRSAGLFFAGGFHAPYVSESIIITDGYVNLVSPGSPILTPGDIKFVSVVLHEIAHAVTYQKCSVNVHGIITGMHRALRHPHVIMRGGAAISAGLGSLLAAVHMVLFGDFVSGFAKVARWELTAWYFKVARLAYIPVDLIYWLAHLAETSNWPAVNPNVITGWGAIGYPFGGLRNVATDWDSDLIKELQESEFRLWEAFQQAEFGLAEAKSVPRMPPEIAAAQLRRDEAEKAWKDKRKELDERLSSAGAVSKYATADVLEDIAETITAVTFGAPQLNAMRVAYNPALGWPEMNPRNAEAVVTHNAAGKMTDGFARRRRYLMRDAGLFPRNWTPMEPGRFMRGKDPFDQLHLWQILY
jgi:hypothetical protein